MPFVTRKSLLTMGALSVVAVLAAAGFVWSGVYNIAADDLHTRPVYALMHTMRERSITVRASFSCTVWACVIAPTRRRLCRALTWR